MFGIRDRGFLKPGYFADITVADPDAERSVSQETEGYRCGWTPYGGVRLKGTVETVFVNGKPAVIGGAAADGNHPYGEKLAFI